MAELTILDRARLVACPTCDEVSCRGKGNCEAVQITARSMADLNVFYKGHIVTQGTEIMCRSHGDQVTWIETLENKGYSFVLNHYNHIITITKLPEVKDGQDMFRK